MHRRIPFNKHHLVGTELKYISDAVTGGLWGGEQSFTSRCERLLEQRFGIGRVLLTPSCTAALELAGELSDLGPGDEVIMPSFTFVSTANAVMRLGARPVFVDVRPDTLNLDTTRIEDAITPRTKAISPVHYAGVGCCMDRIMTLAGKFGLRVIEDAAQGVNASYQGKALGSIGHLGAYSFHQTKNYHCGEGGALCINSPALVDRAEILRDKGTNRRQFLRGEIQRYTWVDVGSSHTLTELAGAFLFAQLEAMDELLDLRRRRYETYHFLLKPLEEAGALRLPHVPRECRSNYHIFPIWLEDGPTRDALMTHLAANGIDAVFHYVPLHTSPMGERLGYRCGELPVTEDLASRILRLPLYYELAERDQRRVVGQVAEFFGHPLAERWRSSQSRSPADAEAHSP